MANIDDVLRRAVGKALDEHAEVDSEDVATLKGRIAELERHNKLLRQVAATTYKNTKELSGYCPSCLSLKGHSDTCPYKAARDAGALGDE